MNEDNKEKTMNDLNKKGYFIEGERLYMREVRLTDVGDQYYNWLNDSEVSQFLETKFTPQSQESIKEYVSQMSGSQDSVFLAIVLKDSDKHIGNIKIGPINWYHRFADIALVIGDRGSWGKGYGTEAIKAVVGYAFSKLNLHRLNAGIYENNLGSIKAFLKAGFKEEGTIIKSRFFNGKYINEKIFGIISE